MARRTATLGAPISKVDLSFIWQSILMDWNTISDHLLDRLGDSFAAGSVPSGPWLLTAVALAAVVVVVPPVWLILRPLVTVTHELGHAIVGILCGRRFTGFVVGADMSGHTVTTGRPTGLGIVLTTVFGYPMPALIGAVMIATAATGRGDIVLLIAMAVLLVALVRSRSVFTVIILATLLAGIAALWWVGNGAVTSTIIAAAGVILLVGAWRQFITVLNHGRRTDDPGMLARITRVPAGLWSLLMGLLIAAPTWWAGQTLMPVLSPALSAVLD